MLRGSMSTHNYFFYIKKDMPWKTPTNCEVPYAIQDQRKFRPSKKGKEVEGVEKAPDKEGSDSASKGA